MIDSLTAKIRIFSFEEKVSLSDTIVIGKVIETNKRLFRKDLVVVEPIRIVKGNLDNDLIRITIKKIPEKLVSGEIFVFFLKKGEVYYDLFATFQGYYHVKNDGFAYYGSDKIPLEDLIRKIEEQGELQTK